MPAEDPPPVVGSWRAAYGLVLVTLAVLTTLFTLITWVYG
jgi:hypothetical protein